MALNSGGKGKHAVATGEDVILNNPSSGEALVYDQTIAKWKNGAVTGSTSVSTTSQTSSYTLVLTDAGKVVEMNSASGVTLTVPTNAAVAFPVGTVVEVLQVGAGQITVAPAAGVTLRTPASLTSRAQWATLGLRKRSINEWVISGDLT